MEVQFLAADIIAHHVDRQLGNCRKVESAITDQLMRLFDRFLRVKQVCFDIVSSWPLEHVRLLPGAAALISARLRHQRRVLLESTDSDALAAR